MVGAVGNGLALDDGSEEAVAVLGHATAHGAVLGHGVADAEADHCIVALTVAGDA